MHLKLMIPGPVELEEEVRQWMGAPNHAHYGDFWVEVHNETIELLREIFATSGKVFMLPGSASLGIDAVVHSLFAPGERVALGKNGWFGQRMSEVLTANGIDITVIECPPNEALDPARFEEALRNDPSITAVVVVHLETSTAVMNPIREIGQVAQKYHRLFVVDAVSSLGGTELKMDEWGIDACMTGSQKALGGTAGLAIVGLSNRAWEIITQNTGSIRSWYLDLNRWQWYAENWADWHPFPITMPTNVVLGFRAALQSLKRDGLEARLACYRKMAARLRSGLKDLGFSLFVPEEMMSPVLTAAFCPEGVAATDIVKYLETEHHIKITSGFAEYKQRVIRIGHMGGAISEADIDELLAALSAFFKS